MSSSATLSPFIRLATAALFCLTLTQPITLYAQEAPKEELPAAAITPEHRALLDEYFTLTEMAKVTDDSLSESLEMQRRHMSRARIPEDRKAQMEAFQTKITELIREELGWEKLKEEITAIYAKAYTEEELKGLIEFYKTPLGKKLVEQQHALLEQTRKLAEERVIAIQPRINAMAAEMLAPAAATPAPGPEATPAPAGE